MNYYAALLWVFVGFLIMVHITTFPHPMKYADRGTTIILNERKMPRNRRQRRALGIR